MTDQIELIPGTNRDVSLSQWFSPPELAQRVVEWAGVSYCADNCIRCPAKFHGRRPRVLEPSAGNGALVRPLVAAGALVTVCELDLRYIQDLSNALGLGKREHRMHCPFDFLDSDGYSLGIGATRFDLCVMNPPYENGLDVAFILHALKFAPRVVGVFRSQILHGVERKEELWKSVRPTRIAFCSRRPFKGAETDYVVLELIRRADNAVRGEFYSVSIMTEWW